MRTKLLLSAIACTVAYQLSCRARATCDDVRPAVIDFVQSQWVQPGATVYIQCGAVRWVLDSGQARPSTKDAVEPECEAHGCSRWELEGLKERFQLCRFESAARSRPPYLGGLICWEFDAKQENGRWRLVNMEVSARA